MRLATRTGLASFVAASITLLAVGALFRGYFATVLQERVDTQLEERAETAPILAAIADRLAQSELRTTLEGASGARRRDHLAGAATRRAAAHRHRAGMVDGAPAAIAGGCTRSRCSTSRTPATRPWCNWSLHSVMSMPGRSNSAGESSSSWSSRPWLPGWSATCSARSRRVRLQRCAAIRD